MKVNDRKWYYRSEIKNRQEGRMTTDCIAIETNNY